jgi:hypothetical protein
VPDSSANWSAGLRWGGPFEKDKAFWIAAYEHQDASTVVPYTGTTADGVVGGRYDARNKDDNAFFRTDFNIDPQNTLMVRLSYDGRSTEGINVGGISTPQWGFSLDEHDVQLAAGLTSVFNPALIHELRLLVGTSSILQRGNASVSGVEHPSAQFGGNNLNRQERDASVFQLVQNLTWVKRHHTMKFGYDVTPSRTKVKARFNPNGNFIYRSDDPFEPGDDGGITFGDLPLRCSEDASEVCVLGPRPFPGLGKGRCAPNNMPSPPFPQRHRRRRRRRDRRARQTLTYLSCTSSSTALPKRRSTTPRSRRSRRTRGRRRRACSSISGCATTSTRSRCRRPPS